MLCPDNGLHVAQPIGQTFFKLKMSFLTHVAFNIGRLISPKN